MKHVELWIKRKYFYKNLFSKKLINSFSFTFDDDDHLAF